MRSCLVAVMIALVSDGIAAQESQGVILRTPGRGRPGVIMQEVLSRPFSLVVPDSVVHFPRDRPSTAPCSLGGDATCRSIFP